MIPGNKPTCGVFSFRSLHVVLLSRTQRVRGGLLDLCHNKLRNNLLVRCLSRSCGCWKLPRRLQFEENNVVHIPLEFTALFFHSINEQSPNFRHVYSVRSCIPIMILVLSQGPSPSSSNYSQLLIVTIIRKKLSRLLRNTQYTLYSANQIDSPVVTRL